MTRFFSWRDLISLCAAAFFCGNALAQYVWTDERGVRQYSDRAPPASVPDSRILKQPGGRKAVPPTGHEQATPPPVAAPAGEKNFADKNADFQRRRLENAEKERKEAEQQQRLAEKTRNCERARDYQRSLESGMRLTLTNKQGEQMPMNDEQREKELRDARRVTAECDKAASGAP